MFHFLNFSAFVVINITCFGSVGLVVDNPEFFNRIAGTFCSKATMRFIVLLWGEKACLSSGETHGVPIFSYKEIIELGRESRVAHIDSHDTSKLINCVQVSDNVFYFFIFDNVFSYSFPCCSTVCCLTCKLYSLLFLSTSTMFFFYLRPSLLPKISSSCKYPLRTWWHLITMMFNN